MLRLAKAEDEDVNNTTASKEFDTMTDAEFEVFASELETTVRKAEKSGARRYAKRDRLGRFVKVHSSQAMFACGVFVNASDGTTHSHTRCGNLKGLTFDFGDTAEGWLCGACVDVPMSAWVAAGDTAPSSGTQVCRVCHTEKRMKSFPTVVVSGWRDRGHTCRKCETTRRALAAEVA